MVRRGRESLRGRLLRYRRRLPPRRRIYARMYGRFENRQGQVRGFEFQVKVSDRLGRKTMSRLIAVTVSRMKNYHIMPLHRRRETFSSFSELFRRPWIRIRRITDYDVTMDYPTPFD